MKKLVTAFGLLAAAAPALVAAEILRLDFSPSPIARFEQDLEKYRLKNGLAARSVAASAPIALTFDRNSARPGERWLEGQLVLRDAPLSSAQIEVELFALGARTPVAKTSAPAQHARGTVAIDLRTANLSEARLVASLVSQDQRLAVAEAFVSAKSPDKVLENGTRIPILLDVPAGANSADRAVVTFGVPFAAGTLWDVNRLRLVDSQGRVFSSLSAITVSRSEAELLAVGFSPRCLGASDRRVATPGFSREPRFAKAHVATRRIALSVELWAQAHGYHLSLAPRGGPV
ncbi:MAG: hypothetical protein M3463_03645 [Verrucomicrobiota bacterium]|nr:hypothetical protein [Verrucomicrobiota bacterium]